MEQFIRLQEEHLTQAAELFRDAFGGEPWNDDWRDTERLMEYIREVSGGYNALNYGLIIDGRLAAFSLGMVRHWWEGTNYNIEEFCVSPEHQGKGTGSRFLGLIEEDLCRMGFSGIFLQTDIDKPAFGFYRKNGFDHLGAHVSLFKRIDLK